MALTAEELAELAAIEKSEQEQQKKAAEDRQRQRLAAGRLRAKLAAKHGVHGLDFLVIDNRCGVFSFRSPLDVELDAIASQAEDRGAQESFLVSIAIEPAGNDLRTALAKRPGLVNSLIPEIFEKLVKAQHEEEAKK